LKLCEGGLVSVNHDADPKWLWKLINIRIGDERRLLPHGLSGTNVFPMQEHLLSNVVRFKKIFFSKCKYKREGYLA
jgi:hypothetical protein